MPPSAEPPPEPAAPLRSLRRAVVLAAAAATIVVFLAVDSHSHSVSDTFYGMLAPEAIVLVVAATALLFGRVRTRVVP